MPPKPLFDRHEADLAEWYGGTRTLASGSMHERADVQMERDGTYWLLLIEAKCTQKKSYSVKLETWTDVVEHCGNRSAEMRPALAIRFYGESKMQGMPTPILADLICISIDDHLEEREERKRLAARVAELEKELASRDA